MPIDTEGKARKLSTVLYLLLIMVLGLCLILIAHAEIAKDWYGILRDVINELGKALIIAGLLGLAIDSALRQNLIRDAVAAAIGYLLPSPLKAELGWLYDQKFLVEQTFVIRLQHKPKDKAVIFHGHYTRIIHNKSGEKATPRISGGVDEWFNPIMESQITKCGITYRGKFTPIEHKRNITGIGYQCHQKIELEPDDFVQVDMAYSFCAPENGLEILTHNYPITHPVVTLDVSDTIKARVAFSHRSKVVDDAPLESGHVTRRLDGLLLPFTDIRVYWSLASALEQRTKSISQPA